MRGLGAPSSWHWLVEGDRCCLGSRAGRQASQTSAAMQRWLQLASRRSNARAEPSDQIRSRCRRPRRSYQTKRPTPRPEAGPEALARQPDQTNRRPGVQRSRKQSRRQTPGLSHTRQPRRNKSRPRQRQPAQPRRSTSAALASRRQISSDKRQRRLASPHPSRAGPAGGRTPRLGQPRRRAEAGAAPAVPVKAQPAMPPPKARPATPTPKTPQPAATPRASAPDPTTGRRQRRERAEAETTRESWLLDPFRFRARVKLMLFF